MKNYNEPKIEMISLSVADVITLSGTGSVLPWVDGEEV